MEMTTIARQNSLYVSLKGEIDHHSASCVRGKIDEIIFAERPRRLIFDFSGVKFMDSSGIGLVLGRHRIVGSFGGSTQLVGASESINKIFKMSGLDKLVEIKTGKDD